MLFFGNKRKEEFQNKIRIQISTCRQQIKNKNDSLGSQFNLLKTRYLKCNNDFAKTFENIVNTEVYIKGANDLISNLTILQQNADLLFDKNTLPSEIQIAFEKCYAVAKLNRQRDLFNLLNPIIKIHSCMTDIVASHESLVYLGIDPINEGDVQTYYPTIKSQCGFEENQFVRQSLAKYSSVFSPLVFSPPFNPGYQSQEISPQFNPVYQSQEISPITYSQNGIVQNYPPQNLPVYQNINEEQNDDDSGLPNDMFISVRPQAK